MNAIEWPQRHDGFNTIVQDYKNDKIEQLYWLRAKVWDQGVYIMIRVQDMKKISGPNKASLSC